MVGLVYKRFEDQSQRADVDIDVEGTATTAHCNGSKALEYIQLQRIGPEKQNNEWAWLAGPSSSSAQ